MALNTDRRRINAPAGGTSAPVFARSVKEHGYLESLRPQRTRGPNELRKIFLQTSIIPSASGSAYLEIPSTCSSTPASLVPPTSSLKLVASIQGPKPLPRGSAYSPTLTLSTTVKFAPFASRTRRGYIRDSIERDLGVHVETALRGVIIGERWPKSAVEVVITVLEGDEDGWWGDGLSGSGWGLLNVLAGCVNVASAAIVDAGIDCVDIVTGGVAAVVRGGESGGTIKLLDPCPAEHEEVVAACAVGYLAGRDEITEIWMKGDVGDDPDELIEGATHAAIGGLSVLKDVMIEALEKRLKQQEQFDTEDATDKQKSRGQDVEMSG